MTITDQIANLRTIWRDLAAAGKHADAVQVENEISALERAEARHAIQHEAEAVERARARAVSAAESTLAEIERHRAARAELEAVVAELEAAAKGIEDAMARLVPAWNQCLSTWPRWEAFKDSAQQEAYDEALEGNRHPRFEPLRLRLRLPLVLDILRERGNRGLMGILTIADGRF